MTLARWFQVLRAASRRARGFCSACLSFVLPIVVWSIVSYVPAVWHPQVLDHRSRLGRLSASRDAHGQAGLRRRGGGGPQRADKAPPKGVPANPIYLPAPHEVAAALYTSFITPPPTQDGPWLHQSLWHSIQVIFWGFVISSIHRRAARHPVRHLCRLRAAQRAVHRVLPLSAGAGLRRARGRHSRHL